MLRYIAVNVIGTLLRFLPMPCKTGLIKIGNPNENSPVFLTGNYCVTVERVKRVLEKEGISCYLLIANSGGINVWCSAAGGHFTHHDVISALKMSGIEKLVNHRKLILPQLAAVGIEAGKVREKTGWNVVWGPVYAKDIPEFLRKGHKTAEMRQVEFSLTQRIEMAVMWAFPFSLIIVLIALFLWKEALFPLFILSWILPLFVFVFFPLYSRFLNQRDERFDKYTVIFDLIKTPLILGAMFFPGIIAYGAFTGRMSVEFILRWSLVSLGIIFLLGIDLMGSTPVYKSGLHEDRFLRVTLDEGKCTGCGVCVQVCPRNCYEIDRDRHLALIPRGNKCVKCGACIVQCPFDALFFKSPDGRVIPPETIRKFKLNLMGQRLVKP